MEPAERLVVTGLEGTGGRLVGGGLDDTQILEGVGDREAGQQAGATGTEVENRRFLFTLASKVQAFSSCWIPTSMAATALTASSQPSSSPVCTMSAVRSSTYGRAIVFGTLCCSSRTSTCDMMASQSVARVHPAANPLAGVALGPSMPLSRTCRSML